MFLPSSSNSDRSNLAFFSAKRANIKQIVLSIDNKKNVDEIDSKYLKGLKFHYVNTMKEVIDISLNRSKVSNSKKLI